MTVQASDDGEVLVQHCSVSFSALATDNLVAVVNDVSVWWLQNANITEPYVEIIGKVIDATTIRMLTCTNLGPELGCVC